MMPWQELATVVAVLGALVFLVLRSRRSSRASCARCQVPPHSAHASSGARLHLPVVR